MNNRDRLLYILQGKQPDRIPFFADLVYLYDSLAAENRLEEKYFGDQGYLRFHLDLNAGICFYTPFLWRTRYVNGVEQQVVEKGFLRTTEFATPVGRIKSVQQYLPSTYSWAYREHFVKDLDDYRIMQYVHENTVYEKDMGPFEAIKALWGSHGIATAMPPISAAPLQKLLARWAGVENTVYMMADSEAEFDEITWAIERSEDAAFEILCDSSADYVEFAENLSSEVTGVRFFEKYNKPYYVRRTRQLHQAGKFCGIHIDGTLGACLPLLHGCGFDVAEAVTPFPVGDLRLESLRAAAGENIVIWGGLPSPLFTPQFSDDEFDQFVKQILTTFRGDHRFVLGVGDQVPPDAVIARVRRVNDMIEAFGG